MRRLVAVQESDQQRLVPGTSTAGFQRYNSNLSLDPNEDPVSGLERVSSINSLQRSQRRAERQRRVRIQQDTNQRVHLNDEEEVLSGKFESLDYEIVENEVYRAEETQKNFQINLYKKSIKRWLICFFIGVFTASVGVFIDITVYYTSRVKYHFIINGLVDYCDEDRIENGGCMWIVLTVWSLYNCVLVAIASLLVLHVSAPAAGSGIPLIKSFLNGVHIPGVDTLKTLLAKATGVAASVAGGLAVGKEGPMIHSGAAVASLISQGQFGKKKLKYFEDFRNDREKRDFVSAGAAAGVAAAFGAPIGGVLFSLEEGASFWNQTLTWRMNGSYNIWEIPFFALIGVMGGLTGALFNALNCRLAIFRKHYIKNKYQKFIECILVAAASAFIGFITLLLVDDCQHIGVNPHLTEVTKLWCPKGKYSAVANLFFQTQEESVKSLFHSPINSFRPGTLFVFAIITFVLTTWTYGLSIPGGIFIPLLLCGAAWGRLVGLGIDTLFPNMAGIDPGKYALAGASAQLGGVVRMTISLTAIMMETTKDISFVMPIMITLWAAKFVGDYFNESIYDSNIQQLEIPILGWNPPKMSRNILASDMMRKDVVALEPKERVGRLLEIIKNTKHHAYPVVDRIEPGLTDSQFPDYGRLQGMMLRSQIFTLLKTKHFTEDYEGRHPIEGARSLNMNDFRESYPDFEVTISSLQLSVEDERFWIDLRPFFHQSPHRVPVNSSLGAIFRLFRGLGLRHIFVVNDHNRLRGVITRKDIARYKQFCRRRHFKMKTWILSFWLCSLISLVCGTRKWELPLEVAVNHGEFSPLGKIELTMQSDGNYTGFFQADPSVETSKLFSKLISADPHAFYSVRCGDVFSSNEVCLIARAQLQHEFALTLDSTRQKLISLTVYPKGIYDAGIEECSLDDLKSRTPTKISGNVVVTNIGELPSPEVATYLQRIEEEKRSRQHGAAQDNRSFFAKYWMYIVPAAIFLLVTNAMGADQQQE
ncbi:Chloride channel and Cystathionine beta-synthase domain containing protein [Aphelenchoides besseyi]|nr:Chloride channel and Cystathionine beta-synthase domain containing protein [Aphelenchoides besseyi]